MSSFKLVRVSNTVTGKLRVTITKSSKTRTYIPQKASAARLHKNLTCRIPVIVFIDIFGPTVFYEVHPKEGK